MSRVFISYSHDSDAHRDQVCDLAKELRNRGFDVTADVDAHDPPSGWARWMEEELPSADRVLMVFTENYRTRYDGKQPPSVGRGVAWETHLIRNILYDSVPHNDRIRVVLFVEDDKRHIPPLLRPYSHYLFPGKFDELCTWLHSYDSVYDSTVSGSEQIDSNCQTQTVFSLQEAGGLDPTDITYIRRLADRELAALLDDQNASCVAIIGDYGIGKTSLLNRVPSMLGNDWIEIRPPIADLRSDKAALCVPHILEAFTPLAGSVTKPSELKQMFEKRRCLLMLDDFGEILEEGLKAILPMLMDLSIDSNGRFRIIATLPEPIKNLLSRRNIPDPKRHKPWSEVRVLPFEENDVRRLLRLLPQSLAGVVLARFKAVKHFTQLHPRRLRIMLNQLKDAKPAQYDQIIQDSAMNDR